MNDPLRKSLADLVKTITLGLKIAGMISIFIFVGLVIEAHDRTASDGYKPNAAIVQTMHDGFSCHADYHSDWPKHHRYEWICKSNRKEI